MKNCYLMQFNSIGSPDVGHLIALEEIKSIPFIIKRVYYTYAVPEGITRGNHAHVALEQILICLHGSITVKVFDGMHDETHLLDNAQKGLYVGPYLWHEMFDYKDKPVLLVLASDYYNENDYIRDYDRFIELVKNV